MAVSVVDLALADHFTATGNFWQHKPRNWPAPGSAGRGDKAMLPVQFLVAHKSG